MIPPQNVRYIWYFQQICHGDTISSALSRLPDEFWVRYRTGEISEESINVILHHRRLLNTQVCVATI